MSLGPGLPPPNSQPSAHKEGQSLALGTLSRMAGITSWVFLANSFRGKAQFPLCTPPWPAAESPRKQGQVGPDISLASQTSSGALGARRQGTHARAQGCYLLLGSCGQRAGGKVYVVSSHCVLPAGGAPHLHGQVVLDASHQLGQRAGAGQGARGLTLTLTSHLSPISHSIPLDTSGTLASGLRPETEAFFWGSLGWEAEVWAKKGAETRVRTQS